MATCTSCNRVIIWAATEGGARMPVDPDPRDDGNVVLVEAVPGRKLAVTLTDDELAALESEHPDRPRYVSHFVTCPMASHHRRRDTHTTPLPLEEA